MSDSDDELCFGPVSLKELKKYILRIRSSPKPVLHDSVVQKLKKEQISMDSLENCEVISISDTSSESDVLNTSISKSEKNENRSREVPSMNSSYVIDLCSDESDKESSMTQAESISMMNLSMKNHVYSAESNNFPSTSVSCNVTSDENDSLQEQVVLLSVNELIHENESMCENEPMRENEQTLKDETKDVQDRILENESLVVCEQMPENESMSIHEQMSENYSIVVQEQILENESLTVLQQIHENESLALQEPMCKSKPLVIHEQTFENELMAVHEQISENKSLTVNEQMFELESMAVHEQMPENESLTVLKQIPENESLALQEPVCKSKPLVIHEQTFENELMAVHEQISETKSLTVNEQMFELDSMAVHEPMAESYSVTLQEQMPENESLSVHKQISKRELLTVLKQIPENESIALQKQMPKNKSLAIHEETSENGKVAVQEQLSKNESIKIINENKQMFETESVAVHEQKPENDPICEQETEDLNLLSKCDQNKYRYSIESTEEERLANENVKNKIEYLDKDLSTEQTRMLNSILNFKYMDDSLTSSNISGVYSLKSIQENIQSNKSSESLPSKSSSIQSKNPNLSLEKDCLLSDSKNTSIVQSLNDSHIHNETLNDIENIEISNNECNVFNRQDKVTNLETFEIGQSITARSSNSKSNLNKLSEMAKKSTESNEENGICYIENNMNLINNLSNINKTFDSTISDNSGFNDTLEGIENLMKYGLHYMTFEKKKNNLTSSVIVDNTNEGSISELHPLTISDEKVLCFHKSIIGNSEKLHELSSQSIIDSCTVQEENINQESTYDKSVDSLHLSKDSELYKTLLRQISDLYVNTDQLQEKSSKVVESDTPEFTEIFGENNMQKKYFKTPHKSNEFTKSSEKNDKKKKYFQTPYKSTALKTDSCDKFKVPSTLTPSSDRKKTDIKTEYIDAKKKYFLTPKPKSCEKYKDIVSPIGLYIKKSASSGLVENVHVKSKQVPVHNLKEHIPVPFQKSIDLHAENYKSARDNFQFGSENIENEACNEKPKQDIDENYKPVIPKCAYRTASEVKMENNSPKLIIPSSYKKYFSTPKVIIKHESRVKATNVRKKYFNESSSNDSALSLETSSTSAHGSSTSDVSIRVTKSALR